MAKTRSLAEFAPEALADELTQACKHLNLTLDSACSAALIDYLKLLDKWNAAYNLSAIRNPQEMLYKHLLDSLALVPLLRSHPAGRLIDVGTGAGLPGIPLAITLPDKVFTLLDSAGKKTRFLFQVCHSLGLKNVQVENRRVEDFRPDKRFDIVLSRAFAPLDEMLGLCKHLLTDRGEFWAMKGQKPQDELSVVEKHYNVVHRDLAVPGNIGERCLVIIQAQQL